MKKLPAVANVRVSLNEGLTIVDLKPDNAMTLTELRQIVRKNGFATREAAVVARGAVTPGGLGFVVAGTGERLATQSPPLASGGDWRLTVPAPEKP
jgi:hypothetical protein